VLMQHSYNLLNINNLNKKSRPERYIVIRRPEDSERLAHSDIPLVMFGAPTIALRLPLPPSSLLKFQAEVDHLTGTCGCVPSAIVMLSILATAAIFIWMMDVIGTSMTNRWLMSVGVFIFSALVGLAVKYAVISRARQRLRGLLLDIAKYGSQTNGG